MNHIETAKRVFNTEILGLNSVQENLDAKFDDAVETIFASRGRVIICGMGKSGIIGKKISATLASTGTQSYFMHPGEAFHGDLGMVDPDDIFIGISYSGETDELLKLLPFLKRNGNHLIAITGNDNSSLARFAHVHLCVNVPEEACPLQLAPTASTTATLVMGDALAVALMQKRSFQDSDFAFFHPGGALGRRLLSTVETEMRTENLPLVCSTSPFESLVIEISKGGLGVAVVYMDDRSTIGIITDGDLRRAFEKFGSGIMDTIAADIMTVSAITIAKDIPYVEALNLMDESKINCLVVVENNEVIGVLKK